MRRPRLEDRLDLGVTGPVTLVSAGTGSGKTLVVASWARARAAARAADGPVVAWLVLDRDDDNEPVPPRITGDGSAWPPDQNTTSG